MKVLVIFGTRPEAIKMCPLVLELEKYRQIETVVCLTGQHREMLRQVMDAFEISEDYNLDIMKARQTLTGITTDILERLEPVLKQEKPDLVLVHGDTTTSYAAALAAFYQQIPVGHVEAGLRTWNIYSPFPEEMNRQLTSRLANIHFSPTERNRANLEHEGITRNVYVTGNTVIDAFQTTVKENYRFHNEALNAVNFSAQKVILVTAHRRENLGQPLCNICHAIRHLTQLDRNILIVYPLHLNPAVRETVQQVLGQNPQVLLLEPLDVLDMHNLMARCFFVMTDSGGIQEEAPYFGKPVLVMRTETERPEAVEAGTVRIVGIEEAAIYEAGAELLQAGVAYSRMAKAVNPYGDGHASKRIAKILSFWKRE